MKINNKQLLSVFLVIILCIAVNIPTASAASNEKLPTDEMQEVPQQYYDAYYYAKDRGITLEEALYHFEIWDKAGELRAELSKNESDTFGGSWIEYEPNIKVVYQFTNNGESIVASYLPKYEELAGAIEVRKCNITFNDLWNEQQQISVKIHKSGIKVDTDADIREGRVMVYVVENEKLIQALLNNELVLPDNVDIIPVERLAFVQTATVSQPITEGSTTGNFAFYNDELGGGVKITENSDGTGNWATSGYSVVRGGTRGIVTVAHIQNPPFSFGSEYIYWGSVNYELYTFNYLKSYGGSADCACYFPADANREPTNKIQISSTGTRPITSTTSRDSLDPYEWVFKYGAASGYTSGQIVSTQYQPTGLSATFIRVHNPDNINLSDGGDSGCPWFSAFSAVGIHYGEPPYPDNTNDAIFMSVDYLSSISCTILTSP